MATKQLRVASGTLAAGQKREDYGAEGAIAALRMFGLGTAAVGTAPALGKMEPLMQCGVSSVTTDAGGLGTITFPNAFPVGLMSVVFVSNSGAGAAATLNAITASTFTFNGTALTNTNVFWIAVGW